MSTARRAMGNQAEERETLLSTSSRERRVRNEREAALQAQRSEQNRSSLQPSGAAQQRPTEEQAILLQPCGTVQSRSPHSAMEEPMVQQWVRPEGVSDYGYPLQEHYWARVQIKSCTNKQRPLLFEQCLIFAVKD